MLLTFGYWRQFLSTELWRIIIPEGGGVVMLLPELLNGRVPVVCFLCIVLSYELVRSEAGNVAVLVRITHIAVLLLFISVRAKALTDLARL